MSEWSDFICIGNLIEGCWPGEWGTDTFENQTNCVVYRATELTDDGQLQIDGGVDRYVDPVKLKAKALRLNDIVLEASGGAPDKPVGRVGIVKAMPRNSGVVSNFFRFLRPNSSVDAQFLTYQLVALNRSSTIWRYQQQTTGIINLKTVDYLNHKVWIPGLSKQKKIAAILTGIDTSIEKTEALIEKYQQIKAGLMHDLFTRGVLPNGQLRPPRDQAPELYQETAIGWIPKDWGEPATLESLLAPVANNIRSGPFGSALLKHELVENGIPFLGIDNIHVEHFDSNFRRFVSDRKFRELARYQVRPRDVVITIMGTVGRCCIIPETCETALSSKHLWTMTFDTEKVVPELICWQLNYASWVKAWFRRATQGGIMDAIQSSTLKTLKLPTPSLDEQILIFRRYQSLSVRIQKETSQLEKLNQQKLGLMQDLLTGKTLVMDKDV